ncbi:MAG: hypothetical protein CVV39_02995 [Planctomycetes bacterium HGW-Planctomycetes-1]|nr:MAG: hypothetical protein CVV39_02995 [Planctomycetes bacterium HGW-Planctomycetes-1]
MRRKSQIFCIRGAGLAALFFFVLQPISFAGLAVSPLQQTVEVKPGKKANFTITLTNNKRNAQTRPCPVRVNILDFTVSDTGQLSFGPENKNSRTAVDWITLDANSFVLEPGESRQVKGTVTAPINADGDYWAAAMVELGKSEKGEKGVQVKLRTASGIFIHVARRNYTERGNITDLNITMPVFDTNGSPAENNLPMSALVKLKEKQSLQVAAKLQNDGLTAISARGKAYVYNDNWRRIAAIPLHSSRRQVLPGDSRWFTGTMPEPLPAGEYKLRTFFASDTKFKRKNTKDIEFTINPDLSDVWAKNFSTESISKLTFEPQSIELKLNPGRITSATMQVTNQGLDTVTANCRIENDGTDKDWLELRTTDFALAPNDRYATSCVVRVPSDAKPGKYNWNILVEMERAGLSSEGQNNTEQYKIPVSIVIDENTSLKIKR